MMGLKVVSGSRYIRGFFGDGAAENICLARKVEGWAESVGTLSENHKVEKRCCLIYGRSHYKYTG